MFTRDLLATYYLQLSADSLAALLQASAHPIYNTCFHVLRHRQDAEDAAQRVLLKVVEEIRGERKIERFDHWLYRTALNTALDARTQRTRRTVHESRKAIMSDTECTQNNLRDSVVEAVAGLDEEACCLIVQHFFEARSLGDIAGDRGVSKMAVWKRIDRAKEVLRRSLQGAGAMAAAARMDEVFGSITPTAAPPDLVLPAILKKATEVAAARTALLGEMAMAAKGFSIATFGTIAILLFVGGAGGALVLSSTLGEPPSTTMRPRQASEAGDKRAKAPPLSIGIDPKTAGILQTSSLPTAPPEAMAARLKSVGGLLREANAAGRKEKDSARANDLYGRLYEEWSAFRPTALADAPLLLAFLRERENEDIVSDLVGLVVNMVRQGLTPSGGGGFLGPGEDPQVPREIIQGLGEMLLAGSRQQKVAVLKWLQDVRGDGNEMLADAWLTLLGSERESEVLFSALLSALNGQGEVDPNDVAKAQMAKFEQRLDVVRSIWQNSIDVKVRSASLEFLAKTKSQADNELFLEKIQEILLDKNAPMEQCICPLACRLEKLALGQEDRYLPILKTAITRITSAEDFERFLLFCPLSLPPTKAIAVLEEARPRSPNASIKTRVDRTLDLLRGGETRSDVLSDALNGTP